MKSDRLFYHRAIKSPHLTRLRDVIVWLPPSYFKTRSRYPVLYMHDGQNIIDPATSFLGVSWRANSVAEKLIKQKRISELIIVGIYNTPERNSEYSGSQKGTLYADFVAKQLKPMIDTHYRTKKGAMHTATLGASMGGLIAFIIAWRHPDIFSMAGCMASAFLWKRNKILNDVANYKRQKKKIKVYIDCGDQGIDGSLLPGSVQMYQTLLSKGYKQGTEVQYFHDKRGKHTERDWSRRLWRPLTFFFGQNTQEKTR